MVTAPFAPRPATDQRLELTISEAARQSDGTVLVENGVVVPGPGITVATIDFLAQGQDGYDMFEPYDFTTVGISYQQSLAQYLEGLGTITDEYADPVDPADRERVVPLP